MQLTLDTSETVIIAVPKLAIPIQHYLRQPQRLVEAIAEPYLMTVLGQDRYRLMMRPINFLELYHFQPVSILKVTAGRGGRINLRSESAEILGNEFINRRFKLSLIGHLEVVSTVTGTQLIGQADLRIQVQVPAPLDLTPQPILETAGQGIMRGVLGRIKQRLLAQLLKDYQHWVAQQQAQSSSGTEPFSLPGAHETMA